MLTDKLKNLTLIKSATPRNSSYVIPGLYDLSIEDANWVLTSSFIIFTMQTGFGMLESGCVSLKNEVNIMMKNIIDIVLGGFTYWIFGYGFSYGRGSLNTPFIALGDFFLDPGVDDPLMGQIFSAFLFQLSFATTATTIVSGAMAERCNFKAYCLFSSINTIIYCVPSGWVWGEHGFLKNLGTVDIAGGGPVHLIGGTAAFASAAMLGPRLGRYVNGIDPLPLGNPVNACMGLFVLWWGWLAFNSGSTYGVSGAKWQFAARAAVMTMMGSFGGGTVSCMYSLWRHQGRIDIIDLINGILGSLVSITAGCYLYRAWEAFLIGAIGAVFCILAMPIFDRLRIDDPVGATSVHGVCGIWGVIAVGLFADNPVPLTITNGRSGLFKGGGWSLLGIQCITAICLICWGTGSTFLLLYIINHIIPIRMDPTEELMGADIMEHFIRHSQVGISRAISALAPVNHEVKEIADMQGIGINPGHENTLQQLKAADDKLRQWQYFIKQTGPVKFFRKKRNHRPSNKEPRRSNVNDDHNHFDYNNAIIYNDWKTSLAAEASSRGGRFILNSPSHQSSILLNNFINNRNSTAALISTISTRNHNHNNNNNNNVHDDPKDDNTTNNMPKFAWVD